VNHGHGELLAPASYLTLAEAVGLPEIAESRGVTVDGVQLDERVDQLLPHPPSFGRRVERRRRLGADNDAVHPLHHVEGSADDRGVVAE
jgi:hypothetical protein